MALGNIPIEPTPSFHFSECTTCNKGIAVAMTSVCDHVDETCQRTIEHVLVAGPHKGSLSSHVFVAVYKKITREHTGRNQLQMPCLKWFNKRLLVGINRNKLRQVRTCRGIGLTTRSCEACSPTIGLVK